MKKRAVIIILAMGLLLLVGIVGSAFSEGTTAAPAKSCCNANCAKFVDNNKDGVCDSMSVHMKDGKCASMAQCKKDGKCNGNCKQHASMKAGAPGAVCDPTKCSSMPAGGCPMKAKGGCPGHK
jgi:hypothetical protein